ncbi:PREDICTED: large subunit GTPase 1 homolog isoform X2 [Nanorana parkeri]|uniref:large subunit GTPase 1 homolog isoform X2 n=1 Tax=Nanorana parkeri TaxID=125878 RepID=UPI000853F742|nr:PREDICTED: large subunit GTPase 1 homolog isoform X2 [Nanorana parkeri]
MGKKKAACGLGRALIRDRAQSQKGQRVKDSWLHTSELNDGYDWGRLNLQSVTEQSCLDDFLATAELAGTEFVAEKLNITFVPAEHRTGLLTSEESNRIQKLHEENKQFLCIPRRPHWDENTSAEDLQQAERESFLKWRRQLATLEEEKKLILTPFERNLDFWRQLWRVIERSDLVVQIADARNPLLFRCQDLEHYVKEISPHKENIILINKADLLTAEQRQAWATYFQKEGMKVVFWSALAEAQRLTEDAMGAEPEDVIQDNISDEEDSEDEESLSDAEDQTGDHMKYSSSDEYEDCEDDEGWQTCSEDAEGENERILPVSAAGQPERTEPAEVHNYSHLVQRDELLEIFRSVHRGKRIKEEQITVGLVGYPNVGKSSTINTILGNKKVSVSATPGHTKHFQTLYVEPGLCLCDCPGLVMPSFVSTKAEMICSGILPIDQMRDHIPPISLIAQRIPRYVLEAIYGINIIRPREDEDQDRAPTSEEFLSAYGYMRGFMTAHGQPDQPRSSRYILKDYVNGKLLYCDSPPGIDPSDFQPQHAAYQERKAECSGAETGTHSSKKVKHIENVVDKNFFHQENVRALTKGVQCVMGYKPGSGPIPLATVSTETISGKPWKRHGNQNKKEKIRRLNKHLDA